MAYYSDLLRLKEERFFRKLALSSIYIYTIRFLDFALVTWLLTNIVKSPSSVGLLFFVKFLPMIFSGMISGWLVDKFTRLNIIRSVIIMTSLYLFAWSFYLFFFEAKPVIIFFLTFLSGILMSIDISSRQSYLANLVRKKNLKSGIALNIILLNSAWFLGPNIGIYFMNFLVLENLYFVFALINAANLIFLIKMPRLSIRKTEKTKYAGFTSGIRYAFKNKILLSTLIIVAMGNLTAFSFESMAPYFARFIYEATPEQFSLIISLQGLGALLGSIIFFPLLVRISRPGLIFALATITLCAGSIIFTNNKSFVAGCITIAMLGAIATFFMNMHSRILLSQTPNPLRGRIQGLAQFAIGFLPIGALLVGILGDNIGILNSMRIFSSLGIITTIFILIFFRDLRSKI
ncbi:MAG: MFS transporter [SAR202 cluster bacterium]|nr:MFS transporter [SAR202 cluster bacterium]